MTTRSVFTRAMPRLHGGEPLAAATALRHFATEDGCVIADGPGYTYLVCTVERGMADPGFYAQVLADALNRIRPAMAG